ncbi:aminoglycoside phosphotransferase family protein [Mucilaginibacter pallidiroseus]|uniref:Aminoglycoside phosphotransferase family protein n=1 Tax=Mucilaginibacter pallidiroseus TaxID=2599295 RepID=A0A563U0T3_9SPHI|nr:aminoglycoside phosphotransferase family protein [Mucilaginibacter pallidiroseus]TWR25163.1 aminoglycoside phosphotransferase family protein [Mucilaginibacter pallidiroseus]
MLQPVLKAYGLDAKAYHIQAFGSGLINHTWKVTGPGKPFILQRINTDVFENPEAIASNLQALAAYVRKNHPSYLFAAPLQATSGKYMVVHEGHYYRLTNFIEASHTVDFLTQSGQAYEAARQFGKFTYIFNRFDTTTLKPTLTDFHNLTLRLQQFEQAVEKADNSRIELAATEIDKVKQYVDIARQYSQIVESGSIPLRVVHHDTKINNVLFDEDDKGIGVIDLDTVMPGYFISDIGDMMRTYLSEANEEEQDISKIKIRGSFFAAIYVGYIGQMGGVLTEPEKQLFTYAGKFMIYMQFVRFLTDYLNGDVYYQTNYEAHNLVRARNQLCLLERYIAAIPEFENIISHFGKPAANTEIV